MQHLHLHSNLPHKVLMLLGFAGIGLLEQECTCKNPSVEPYSKDDIEKIQAIAISTAATEPPENITTEPLSSPPDDDDDEDLSAIALPTEHTTLPPSPSLQPPNSPQPVPFHPHPHEEPNAPTRGDPTSRHCEEPKATKQTRRSAYHGLLHSTSLRIPKGCGNRNDSIEGYDALSDAATTVPDDDDLLSDLGEDEAADSEWEEFFIPPEQDPTESPAAPLLTPSDSAADSPKTIAALLMRLLGVLLIICFIGLHILPIAFDCSPEAIIEALENNLPDDDDALPTEDSQLNNSGQENHAPQPENNPPEASNNQENNHAPQPANNPPEASNNQENNHASQPENNPPERQKANLPEPYEDPIAMEPPAELVDKLLTLPHTSEACKKVMQYILSLPADSKKMQEIYNQLRKRGPVITERSIKRIGKWLFEKYIKDYIALACDLEEWHVGTPRGPYHKKNDMGYLKKINKEAQSRSFATFYKRLLNEQKESKDLDPHKIQELLFRTLNQLAHSYRRIQCLEEAKKAAAAKATEEQQADTTTQAQEAKTTEAKTEDAKAVAAKGKALLDAYHYNEDHFVESIKQMNISPSTMQTPAINVQPCKALDIAATEIAKKYTKAYTQHRCLDGT